MSDADPRPSLSSASGIDAERHARNVEGLEADLAQALVAARAAAPDRSPATAVV